MNEILALSLQSMHGDMARLDQVGMNLANVLTPGYKRGVALQAPIGMSFAGHLSAAADASSQAEGVAAMKFTTDMRPGTLKSTGQPLDLAIAGKGYFEVMTPEGLAYTRHGSFQVDARGRLVTAQGHALMGAAGEITVDSPNPTISVNGIVKSGINGAPLGQLKLLEFAEGEPQHVGDGLFSAGTRMNTLPEKDVQLRQTFLENSNATSTLEMAALVKAMRHFEGMQKVVQGCDEMLGVAIRKLGETG